MESEVTALREQLTSVRREAFESEQRAAETRQEAAAAVTLRVELEGLRRELATLRAGADAKSDALRAQLVEQAAAAAKSGSELSVALRAAQDDNIKVSEALRSAQQAETALLQELVPLRSEIEVLRDQREFREQEARALADRDELLQRKLATAEEQWSEMRTLAELRTAEICEMQMHASTLETERAELSGELARCREDVMNLRARVRDFEEERQVEGTRKEFEAEARAREADVSKQHEAELARAERRTAQAEAATERAKGHITELDREIIHLRKCCGDLEKSFAASHAYKAELEHKVKEQKEALEAFEAEREGRKTVQAAETEVELLRELLQAERKQRADLEAAGSLAKRTSDEMGDNDENTPPEEGQAVAKLRAELATTAAKLARLERASAGTIEELTLKLDEANAAREMSAQNLLKSQSLARSLTTQLDEAEAAREKAVANLQKSRQEGSGLAQQYAALAQEHARLQAVAQEAAHATAQLEERLRTAHENLARVEATGQAQHRRAAKAVAAANVADAERAAAAAEKAAAERELTAVRASHKSDISELRSTMSMSQAAEVDRLQGELLSLTRSLDAKERDLAAMSRSLPAGRSVSWYAGGEPGGDGPDGTGADGAGAGVGASAGAGPGGGERADEGGDEGQLTPDDLASSSASASAGKPSDKERRLVARLQLCQESLRASKGDVQKRTAEVEELKRALAEKQKEVRSLVRLNEELLKRAEKMLAKRAQTKAARPASQGKRAKVEGGRTKSPERNATGGRTLKAEGSRAKSSPYSSVGLAPRRGSPQHPNQKEEGHDSPTAFGPPTGPTGRGQGGGQGPRGGGEGARGRGVDAAGTDVLSERPAHATPPRAEGGGYGSDDALDAREESLRALAESNAQIRGMLDHAMRS